MKNENEGTEGASGQPKKLLLGKRVLRHFNVRTSIQTGAKGTVVYTSGNPTSNPDPTLDPTDDGGTSKDDGTYSSVMRCR